MQWNNEDSQDSVSTRDAAAKRSESMKLYNEAGTAVASFTESADGTVTFTVNGVSYLAPGASTVILDLPTVDPEVAGQLWADTGTVKVSAGA
jgi:hypothetical protein